MRIHGTHIIKRRACIEEKSRYEDYEEDLRIDFENMCGYCGKHEKISTKGMETDHFVPKKIAPERENDYTNLVYSCFTCNRKKWGKWPTENKNLCHDGKKGLVDPATEEYHLHLGRTSNGDIEAYTPVGECMLKEIFKFHVRPMAEIWKASRLQALLQEAAETGNGLGAALIRDIEHLNEYLFTKKE